MEQQYKSVGYFDIVVSRGASYATSMIIKVDNEPLNLTDYDAKLQVRDSYDSEDILYEMSTDIGNIEITPMSGKVDLIISKDDSVEFDFDVGLYDLLLISPSGEVLRYLEGNFRVLKGVTRLGPD